MATVGGVSLGGFAYAYDATGRIVERDISLGDASSPSNPSQSQPSPMPQSSHKTYSYDSLDRLAMDGDVSYTYDAAGNRLSKIDSAQGTTLYTLGVGDRLATYGRARSPSAPQPAEGTYSYDTAGNVMYIIAYFDYDAWGNILSATSTVPTLFRNRYRFQGREWSAATGLTNFRMRWYDAETGRWLSKDPIGLKGGLNLYVSCDNIPLCRTDPLGANPLISLVRPPPVSRTLLDNPAKASPLPRGTGIPEGWRPSPDPLKPNPPSGFELRGPPGKGNYYNPWTKESLRPDLNHPDGVEPHWDYKDPFGNRWRWFLDGVREPKPPRSFPPAPPQNNERKESKGGCREYV